jgi:hypothetical protein
LVRHDLHQTDVEVQPPIAPLGPDYIRPIRSLGASTRFHFRFVLGFCRQQRLERTAAQLSFGPPRP